MKTLILMIAGLVFAAGAVQAETGKVDVELNKLEALDGACRAYLVVRNGTKQRLDELKVDLVLFDDQGIVAKRLAVQLAPLPTGKTSLKVFDIAELPCPQVGQVLLNAVMSCRDATGKRPDCLSMLAPSAKGAVPFIM